MLPAVESYPGEQCAETVQQMQVAETQVSMAESVLLQSSRQQHGDMARKHIVAFWAVLHGLPCILSHIELALRHRKEGLHQAWDFLFCRG